MVMSWYFAGWLFCAGGFSFSYIIATICGDEAVPFDFPLAARGFTFGCVVALIWPVLMFGLLVALYHFVKEKHHEKEQSGESM